MAATAKTSLPTSFIQTGAYLQRQPYYSFRQTCCNARVSKVCKVWTEDRLAECLRLMRASGPLCYYESVGMEGGEAPPTIQDVRDLKRRYVEVLQFSAHFAVFEDLQSVVMIARSARILKINGSPWMGVYNIHIPIFNEIRERLRTLSNQKKIALFQEASVQNNNGKPISGYQFGLEEPLSHLLTNVLAAHSTYLHWLSKTNNGTAIQPDEDLLKTEFNLFKNFNFPILLCDTDILKSLSPNAAIEYSMILGQDKFTRQVLSAYTTHLVENTLTPGKERVIYVQLMTKSKDTLLRLIRLVALDVSEQLIKQKELTPKDKVQITSYLDTPYESPQHLPLVKDYIKPVLGIDLRNRMWGKGIQLSSPRVPKNVPRVLIGGKDHITAVLKLIGGSTTSSPGDSKESKKK